MIASWVRQCGDRTRWSFQAGAAVFAGLTGVALLVAAMSSTPDGHVGRLPALSPSAGTSQQSTTYPNCRFAVGGSVDGYDVAALNVGWIMDWSAQTNPPHPGGAEYAQMVRLQPEVDGYSFTPTTATLQAILAANPGSLWLIGNEPDSPFQDNLWPEDYARAYHQVYSLIKQDDPSARIGVGGIVQPTPLRFQYLDRFFTTYQQLYGEPPPADFWNFHSYILREIDSTDPDAYPNGQQYAVWGAYIPPGITATRGLLYSYADMFSPTIFRQRLIDFRAWMSMHGYGDTPLLITEYGELFPYPPYTQGGAYVDEFGAPITEQRVAAFMTSTFDILRTLTDTNVGHPADANRLVQRWLWYSVHDTSFGGPLFDPATTQRRPLGDVFYTYTHALSPSVDLLAVRVVADPPVSIDTGQSKAFTLKAQVSNVGDVSVTQPIRVAFYAGWPPTGTQIGPVRTIASGLAGCAGVAEVTTIWTIRGAGAHPMYVVVDPSDTIVELGDSSNVALGSAFIAAHTAYLPAVVKGYLGGP